MSDDPVDQELERMAGSREAAEEVKRTLVTLRDGGAGPELAEMARDVLEGRISFRDVARSSAYAEPLMKAQEALLRWRAQADEEEQARLVAETQKRLYGDQDL
ncbi:hypothetical protein [Actinoplanes hulinensis]|nr:hypothetical protein [Actinoplanes hulinensis]